MIFLHLLVVSSIAKTQFLLNFPKEFQWKEHLVSLNGDRIRRNIKSEVNIFHS